MSARVSTAAYLSVVAHAAKYATHDINGVFLADDSTGAVVAAAPLFHRHLSLSPMLQMALLQVRAEDGAIEGTGGGEGGREEEGEREKRQGEQDVLSYRTS